MKRPVVSIEGVAMNVRSFRVVLLVVWLFGSWIGGLALPVAAQSATDSIQESIVKKTEGGFLLKSASSKSPVPAPLLNTTVTMTISGQIARTTVSQQFTNPSLEW